MHNKDWASKTRGSPVCSWWMERLMWLELWESLQRGLLDLLKNLVYWMQKTLLQWEYFYFQKEIRCHLIGGLVTLMLLSISSFKYHIMILKKMNVLTFKRVFCEGFHFNRTPANMWVDLESLLAVSWHFSACRVSCYYQHWTGQIP